MNRTCIVKLSHLSKNVFERIRFGQIESAKVWNYCTEQRKLCFEKKREWVTKNSLQKETKSRFCIHSQSVQMICRNFIGCVEQTRKNKKRDKRTRYPYKEKKFLPILWTAQAMSIHGNRVILPMGRGRKNLVFDKPDWLKEKAPSKIIWNSGYEWTSL